MTGRPSIALRRMDFLAAAIRSRNWDDVEFLYGAVLSALQKELGVPRAGRPAPTYVRGHVPSATSEQPAQHAVPASAGERARSLCGRHVLVDEGRPAFDPDAGVVDPPCGRCVKLVRPEVEDERESFTFMAWTWDVTGAKAAVADQLAGEIEVSQLRHLLGLINVDPDYARTVDMAEPIILGWLPNADGTIPIDGWHRIARAVQDGVPTLKVKQLTREESAALIINDRS